LIAACLAGAFPVRAQRNSELKASHYSHWLNQDVVYIITND